MAGRRIRALGAAAALVIAGITAASSGGTASAAPFSYPDFNEIQKRLASGALSFYFDRAAATSSALYQTASTGRDGQHDGPDGLPETAPNRFTTTTGATRPTNYRPTGTGECHKSSGDNVKVNQNCLNLTDPSLQGRGQANNETFIAVDRYHPAHLVASDNDYARGDGNCGAAYSTNGGRTWNDAVVPMSFTAGDSSGAQPYAREYWQAGGDTSVAWDTRGNAYLSCQVFNRGGPPTSSSTDLASAFLVFRSTSNGGASYNFPGRYAAVNFDPAGTSSALLDKELIAVDNYTHSPFRDRIYVTYTLFASDGTAYIYAVHSNDYGETFSKPVLVSRGSAMCSNTYGVPTPQGSCNENQDSDPFVGPDGSLYVAWNNYNNSVHGGDNRNQVLLAKSSDGGQTFSPSVLVGNFYDLPDCFTYQGDDPGRACVPEKGRSHKSVFRATNYPSGAVNPRDPSEVSVTYGSYINRHSKDSTGCVPDGFSQQFGTNLYLGVKTAGACSNDIVLSVSHDRGGSFTGTTTGVRSLEVVTQAPGQRSTDQFWQWASYTDNGTLVVSYMDRQYGKDETSGFSDVSLSSARTQSRFRVQRVTTGSMPPPTEFFGTAGGLFYGDYQGLAASSAAYPVWSDTRSAELFLCPESATGPGNPPRLCHGIEPNGQLANDQDVYTARVSVPSGG